MRTPNDYLREVLIELAAKAGLNDSEIARAHNRAYNSRLNPSSVWNFRNKEVEQGTPPSRQIEEAFAAATGTTREQNWNEAMRRWRVAMKQDTGGAGRPGRSVGRSARQQSA